MVFQLQHEPELSSVAVSWVTSLIVNILLDIRGSSEDKQDKRKDRRLWALCGQATGLDGIQDLSEDWVPLFTRGKERLPISPNPYSIYHVYVQTTL